MMRCSWLHVLLLQVLLLQVLLLQMLGRSVRRDSWCDQSKRFSGLQGFRFMFG
jgi:hypothetical protein